MFCAISKMYTRSSGGNSLAGAACWPSEKKTSNLKSERFLVISESSRRLATATDEAWGYIFRNAQIKEENSYIDKD